MSLTMPDMIDTHLNTMTLSSHRELLVDFQDFADLIQLEEAACELCALVECHHCIETLDTPNKLQHQVACLASFWLGLLASLTEKHAAGTIDTFRFAEKLLNALGCHFFLFCGNDFYERKRARGWSMVCVDRSRAGLC